MADSSQQRVPGREGGPWAGTRTQPWGTGVWVVNADRQAWGRGRASGQLPKRPAAGVQGPASYHTSGSVWTMSQGPWLRNVPSKVPANTRSHVLKLFCGLGPQCLALKYRPSHPPQMLSPPLELSPSDLCLDGAHKTRLYTQAPGTWRGGLYHLADLVSGNLGQDQCETKAKILTVWLGTRSHLLG